MNQRPLVLLAAGRSQLPLIDRANQLGFATWAFDREAAAPGSELASRFAAVSAHDADSILARLRSWVGDGEPAGILTSSSAPGTLLASALVARALSLRGTSHGAIKRVLDRGAQRTALIAASVPVPPASIVLGVEEAVASVERMGRAVLKPAGGTSGSAGVFFAQPGPELELRARAAASAGDGRIVVEEVLRGDEYSIDALAVEDGVRVISVTRKETAGNPPLPVSFSTPVATDEEKGRRSLFFELAGLVAESLELEHTAFNLDVIFNSSGPVVIEVGCLLDAKIDRLLDFAGLDVYGALCQVAVGELPSAWKEPRQGLASRFLYGSRLLELGAERMARAVQLVEEQDARLEWQLAAGDSVRPARALSDTVGWILCRGKTGAAARELAESLAREVSTILELDEPGT